MAALWILTLLCGAGAALADDGTPGAGAALADELWRSADLLEGADGDTARNELGAPTSAPTTSPLDDADGAAVEVDADPRGERPVAARRGGRAAASATSTTSTSSSWVRTTTALVAVVALILLLSWGYRTAIGQRGLSLMARPRHPGLLEVVTRTALSARQVLYLVRVGPRLVLLGAGGDGLRALHVIEDADLCARLLGAAASHKAESESAAFQNWLEEAARTEPAAEALDEPPAPDGGRLSGVRAQLQEALGRLRARTGERG